jgi:hypothetical protein
MSHLIIKIFLRRIASKIVNLISSLSKKTLLGILRHSNIFQKGLWFKNFNCLKLQTVDILDAHLLIFPLHLKYYIMITSVKLGINNLITIWRLLSLNVPKIHVNQILSPSHPPRQKRISLNGTPNVLTSLVIV